MVKVIQPLLEENEREALGKILDYLADNEKDYAALPREERSKHIFRSVLILRTCPFLYGHRFDGGRDVFTLGALAAMERTEQEPWEFLQRHFAGDWGDVGPEDWAENQLSLANGFRILSSYRTKANERLWVITEADRSSTTILLPEEY